MGKLTLLLLAILVWLQYSLWFGKNGIHYYTRVNDDVAAQQATNAKLKARTIKLFAEIDDHGRARRRSKSVRVMNSA